jgi:hypothetical protein
MTQAIASQRRDGLQHKIGVLPLPKQETFVYFFGFGWAMTVAGALSVGAFRQSRQKSV